MEITFSCTNCHQELEVGAEAIGTPVECPTCHTALTVPRKELGPGVTIGGFRIERLLGVGGMGQVYLARQLSLDREIALKILPAQMSLQPEAVQRFLSEVKLLARLDHPNIVTAFEAGEDAGVLFLAMAYVRGESLAAKLKRTGALPEAEALPLIEKVAGALGYAWDQHQLLHRDIKPDNILLDPHGEPKLVDLGLAKSLTTATTATVSGMVMGTPNYMSPEQAQGLTNLDCRTDIYSLGMTLYHMVSGKVPFASSSLLETLRKQVSEQLPDPRQFNPQISEPCVTLLETMLAKEVDCRHTTWELLIADLNRVRHKQSPSQQLQKVGGSMLMRLPKSPGPLVHTPASTPAATIDLRPTRKSPLPRIAAVATLVVAVAVAGVWWMENRSRPPVPPAKLPPTSAIPAAPVAVASPQPPVVDAGQAAFLAAQEFVQSKPNDFEAALARFSQVKQTTAGTPWAEQAEREIARLKTAKARAIEQAVATLRAETDQAIASGAFTDAVQKLEEYHGAFATETAAMRADLVTKLHRKEAEGEKTRQTIATAKEQEAAVRRQAAAQTALTTVLAEAAADVLQLDYAAARKHVITALADPDLQPVTGELTAANDLLGQLATLPDAVLAGFEREKGKTITLEFQNGSFRKLTVAGINTGKVKAQQELAPGQFAEWNFSVNELTTREKLKRLEANATTAGMLMRGYLSIVAGNWPVAEREFSQMGPGLGATLAAAIKQRITAQQLATKETPAKLALAEILQVIGLPATQSNLAEVIRSKAYTANQVAKTHALVEEFQKKYGDTVTAQTNEIVLAALAAVSTEEAFKPVPLKAATEENVKAAIARLRKINQLQKLPVYRIKDGTIVMDLSGDSGLLDISPLAGLPLVELNLNLTAVKNLQPLAGMPLKILEMAGTKVRDLTPLHNLESLEKLDCGGTPVSDLSPLHGLTKLIWLWMDGCPGVRDLAPLQGRNAIVMLNINGTSVESLLPLKNIQLRNFRIGNAPVDLSPLGSAHIENLDVVGNARVDLSVLTNAHIVQLDLGQKMKPLKLAKGLVIDRLVICGDWSTLEGLDKLPEALPELKEIYFSFPFRPESACPAFVFQFPNLQTISWRNRDKWSGTVAEFKAKYIKPLKN